jgi:hypothetical protein
MPQTVRCPECRHRFPWPEDRPGEEVRCPNCRATFDPPSEAAVTPAPPRAGRGRDGDEERDGPRPRRTGPASRPVRTRSAWPFLLGLFGVFALVLVAGAVAVGLLVAYMPRVPPAAPPHAAAEDEGDRRNDVREAFADRKPLDEKEIAADLPPFFEKLGADFAAEDPGRALARFDLDRMCDELAAVPGLPLRTPKERRGFATGMREGMGRTLSKRGAALRWTASEVRAVKKLNNDEAVVIVRHRHPDGFALKMRWWLTRRSGEWKVYDLEDLDMGMRVSVLTAAVAAQGAGNLTDTSQAMRALGEAFQALRQQDPDTADRKLAQVGAAKLPKQVEALRQLATGMVRLQRGQAAEALEAVDAAEALQADIPLIDFLRGRAQNLLGKWDKAVTPLEKYRDLLGDDAPVCRELGLALRGQKRFADAAKEYRKALDANPKDALAYQGLLKSLAADAPMDDLGPRFAKLDSSRENFDVFAADCERRQFPQLLVPLVEAMRKIDPKYAPVDYYGALAQVRTGHADRAVPLFQSALAKQPDAQQKRVYAEHFVEVMATAGHGPEAYAVAPDARAAFAHLAASALKRKRGEELRLLVAAHGKKEPADPLLPWYQAEVYAHDGRYARAQKTLASAKPPDEETLAAFRATRVLCRYHTGEALAAYAEIGPRADTFRQLADLAWWDEDDKLLQDLLDAHAKNDPQSLDLLRYRSRLHVRRGRTDEGIALFKSAVGRKMTGEVRTEIVAEFLGELVAAGKPLEAYRAGPDPEEAFRVVAEQLLEDADWQDLRRLTEAHRAGHAGDPWLAYYEGEVQVADAAWDRAAEAFASGLKNAPKDLRDTYRSRLVFARYKAGQWKRAYEETGSGAATFTELAGFMDRDKKAAELQALCDAHQPQAPDSPELLFYQALAKVFAREPASAAALLRKAFDKQPEEWRRLGYVRRFAQEMEARGQMLEGYRAAPDRAAAFEALAPRLLGAKKEAALADLLKEHEQLPAARPLCEFYRGESEMQRGAPDKAEPHFAAAFREAAPQQAARFRGALFRARVKTGKAVATYEQVEPRRKTFEELAALCASEKDAAQLRALLDAHRKADPDDAALTAWEMEQKWLSRDYEGTLRLLDEHRDGVLDEPRFRHKADDYRVRCLVRLKRPADAVREAKALANEGARNPLLLALAHAAAGDVNETIAVLDRRKASPALIRTWYQDEDLGPILRGEPFGAFRQRFPEPTKPSPP